MNSTSATLSPDWHGRANALAIDGRAFIDGRRATASKQHSRPSTSPIDGRVLAELAACGPADVDRAVAAARRASRRGPAWGPKGERGCCLRWLR
jgi:gamma-glutamyl-gamma-aminobutyraldehyde dehydrogenase